MAHHRTGGGSRLRSERRSVVLRGQKTTVAIYEGLERFLSALYNRKVRGSLLLEQVGVEASDIERLRDMQHLKNLAMDLCPALREWLIDRLGLRPTDILIELYGIYGDEPMTYQALARGFDFKDEAHARNYIAKMMRQLRSKEATDELEGLVREVAIAVLKRSHK